MQWLLLPTTTTTLAKQHSLNTGQSATRAAERQLRFCWFSVTHTRIKWEREKGARTSKLERSRTATEKPQICRAACGQCEAPKATAAQPKTSTAALTVKERPKLCVVEWVRRRRDVRCRLGKGNNDASLSTSSMLTWRKRTWGRFWRALWCVSWLRSRAWCSGEFAFAAPTAATCCLCF